MENCNLKALIALYIVLLVCYLYVTRISSVCHSYVPVCHSYVTPMCLYVIRMSPVSGFTMSLFSVYYLNFHDSFRIETDPLKILHIIISLRAFSNIFTSIIRCRFNSLCWSRHSYINHNQNNFPDDNDLYYLLE